jgi:hypothetical protein
MKQGLQAKVRYTRAAFRCRMTPLSRPDLGGTMADVMLSASTILSAFGDVQSELVGKAVVLTDGKAGTVEKIWLDEVHGLRISIKDHDGKWPVSTIKFEQAYQALSEPAAG